MPMVHRICAAIAARARKMNTDLKSARMPVNPVTVSNRMMTSMVVMNMPPRATRCESATNSGGGPDGAA